ncbi:MAG: potassium channel family protein [Pseudomonadota bacterium]|nr:potassium channel family protein [Pseudomonadota bacterium]
MTTENNFIYLTLALLILLFASAVVEQYAGGYGQGLITASTVLMLIVGIFSIRSERRWFHTGLGLISTIVLVAIAESIMDQAGLGHIHLLIMLGFFSLTAWLAIQQVLSVDTIYRNRITGAICFYLLLGMIWAIIYLLLMRAEPGSFAGISSTDWQESFLRMIYFSFITLTTLGYGDISAALPVSRFFVYLEAIVGQFYLAILVASLIGMRFSVSGNKE